MRKIKFRGYNKECNKWGYGYLVKRDKDWIIVTEAKVVNNRIASVEFYVIDKESIGQYTGLKDKNSVEIFEGDVVKFSRSGCGIIEYDEEGAKYLIKYFDTYLNNYNYKSFAWKNGFQEEIEVIGNIYENPEFLKVTK